MGVIHLGDRHLIGIAFHNSLGQVVVVSFPLAEQPIPVERSALVIEGHGVHFLDHTVRNAADDDRVESGLYILGKRNPDRRTVEGDGFVGNELLDPGGNGILVGTRHDNGNTALQIGTEGHRRLSVDGAVTLREETGIVGLHGIVLGLIARENDGDVRRILRQVPTAQSGDIIERSDFDDSRNAIVLEQNHLAARPFGLVSRIRLETGGVADVDMLVGFTVRIDVRISDSRPRIVEVDQAGLGEGDVAELVTSLGHVDDQVLGLGSHEFLDMVLVRVDLALVHLGRERLTGEVVLGELGFAEGLERGRILVGNRQLGLSVRSALVEDREVDGVVLGELPIRRRDRESERRLVAAGREVRGHGRGAGDEAGLVDNGDGRRGGRSGLETEDVNADGLRRMADVDRRRLVRREIVLRTACLGTGLIRGLFCAGEKSRRGEERQGNVC